MNNYKGIVTFSRMSHGSVQVVRSVEYDGRGNMRVIENGMSANFVPETEFYPVGPLPKITKDGSTYLVQVRE